MKLLKENIVEAFRSKILGVRNYRDKNGKQEFTVDDFAKLEDLACILDEIFTGESDITPAGKSFLEKYYGFNELAKSLFDSNLLSERSATEKMEDLRGWLETLEPMETIKFIEEARGNLKGGEKLPEDLLPPENI